MQCNATDGELEISQPRRDANKCARSNPILGQLIFLGDTRWRVGGHTRGRLRAVRSVRGMNTRFLK